MLRRWQIRQVVREAALLRTLCHPGILAPTAVFTEIFGGKLKAFVETPFQVSPPDSPNACRKPFFAALLSVRRAPFSRIFLDIILCHDVGDLQNTC